MSKNNERKDSPSTVLRIRLETVLGALQKGIIPNDASIAELKNALAVYKEACANMGDTSQNSGIVSEGTTEFPVVEFRDVMPHEIGNNAIINDTLSNPGCIWMLKQLVYKKLVPEFIIPIRLGGQEQVLSVLLSLGIIAPVTIKAMDESHDFYCLTTNGWYHLKEGKLLHYITEQEQEFIIPDHLCCVPNEWSEATFVCAAMIQYYYDREAVDEYFVFSDSSNPGILMGCEIKDIDIVNYCCAWIFDEDIDTPKLERMCAIVSTEKVDELTVIVQSKEESNRLMEKLKIEGNSLDKMVIYCLVGDES